MTDLALAPAGAATPTRGRRRPSWPPASRCRASSRPDATTASRSGTCRTPAAACG